MRRILPRTFFWQLVLGTVLVQTLLLGVFISYTVVSQMEIAQARTQQRTTIQLTRLATACSEQLTHGNMGSVHDVLELSRIAPTIEVARLTDLNGKTLAVSDSGRNHGLDAYELNVLQSGVGQRVFAVKNGQVEAVTPVLRDGKAVALLWLEPNPAVSLNVLNAVVRVSSTYGAFALLANLIPIFLIVRTMTRPLRRLREATRRLIRNPDPKGEFPLPVTTENEAGELTSSFNIMVGELEAQRNGLLDTLALLDSMLGNAPIGFAFLDRELRYVRINQFLANMFDRPHDELLGERGAAMYPSSIAGEIEACLTRVFETGNAIRNMEFLGRLSQTPDLQRSWLMHFYPVRTHPDAIRWVGVVVVEITERLQAEETLRKTEKLAATGRLAASIAHEINNPLEAVMNLLYLLETHEPMDPVAIEYVNLAQAELSRVSEITQQTLRFYRQSTLPSRTNFAELLVSVCTLYQSRMTAANVTLMKQFRGEPEVFGFGGELRQVFANLIGNAIDAMPDGGCLALRARRSTGRGADGVWCEGARICVADTGMGMARETLAKIFEAFFTTKQVTGTGLGLWVSREIIQKHSGTVRVRSRLGADGVKSGTSFMLFFPNQGIKEVEGGSRPAAEPVPLAAQLH